MMEVAHGVEPAVVLEEKACSTYDHISLLNCALIFISALQ
jgi:hypothetical protein